MISRPFVKAAIDRVHESQAPLRGTKRHQPAVVDDASILFAVVRELGLASISFEDVNDIFHQILKNKVDAPFVSDEPTVTLDELCEWIETISALNDAYSAPNHRTAHRRLSPSLDSVKLPIIASGESTCSMTTSGTAMSRISLPTALQPLTTSDTATSPSSSAGSETRDRSTVHEALAQLHLSQEVHDAMASKTSSDIFLSLSSKQFSDVLSKLILETVTKPEGSERSLINKTSGKSSQERRTLAFSSALALRHVGSGTGASMGILGTLLFVDISGYSAVTNAIEGMGAHALSSVVNGYLEKIVRVIRANGGDVVKFAGDALLAVWCTEP
ncbi:guanylate cyclase, putative, partial [Bodo saltans]